MKLCRKRKRILTPKAAQLSVLKNRRKRTRTFSKEVKTNRRSAVLSNLPPFEFVNVHLNTGSTFNRGIESNVQYIVKPQPEQPLLPTNQETFQSSFPTCIKVEPPDPLELSEIKIEPILLEVDLKTEIKTENDHTIREACDVGDHNYAFVNRFEHSYAKRQEFQEDLIEKQIIVPKHLKVVSNNQPKIIQTYKKTLIINKKRTSIGDDITSKYLDLIPEKRPEISHIFIGKRTKYNRTGLYRKSVVQHKSVSGDITSNNLNITSNIQPKVSQTFKKRQTNGSTSAGLSRTKVRKVCGDITSNNQLELSKTFKEKQTISSTTEGLSNKSSEKVSDDITSNNLNITSNVGPEEKQTNSSTSADLSRKSVEDQIGSGGITSNIFGITSTNLNITLDITRSEVAQPFKEKQINSSTSADLSRKSVEDQGITSNIFDLTSNNFNITLDTQSEVAQPFKEMPINSSTSAGLSRKSVADQGITSNIFDISSNNLSITSDTQPEVSQPFKEQQINTSGSAVVSREIVEDQGISSNISDITSQGQPQVFESLEEKQKWQAEVETLLRLIYIKDSEIPASNKGLPPNPAPVIDLVSDSSDIAIHFTDEGVLNCRLCGFKAIQPSVMELHMIRHQAEAEEETPKIPIGRNLFKCTECSFICTLFFQLIEHLHVHVNVLPHVCKKCHYRTEDETSLMQHGQTHESLPNCRLSGRKTLETLVMGQDMVKCKTEAERKTTKFPLPRNRVKCTKCTFSCAGKFQLIEHLRVHSRVLPYVCKTCHYRTEDAAALKQHEQTHKGVLNCRLCTSKTAKNFIMKQHMIKHKTKPKVANRAEDKTTKTHNGQLKCTECTFTCALSFQLIKHLQVHANVLRHVCKICNYKAANAAALMQHEQSHKGLLNCRLCGFKTGQTFVMEQHMVKHARSKTYRCYECDFVTWHANELASHKQNHLTVPCECIK